MIEMASTTLKSAEDRIVIGLSEKRPTRVLHVDDDPGFLNVAKQCLEAEGPFQIDGASSVAEAFERMKDNTYDVIVSDFQMPVKDGLDFLRELRDKGNATPFIVFTGKGREEVVIKALNLGADGYINKIGDPETVYYELKHAINEIVERRRTEERLHEEEIQHRTLIENAPDVIYSISGASGTLTSLNPAFEKITGWHCVDWIGKSFASLIHPDDLSIALEVFRKTLEGKTVSPYELRVLSESGAYLVGEFTSWPWVEKGKIVGKFGIVRDITERKKAEEKTRESEQKYRDLIENAPDAIFIHDLKGKILSVNKTAEEYGFKRDELVGKNMLRYVPKKYWPRLLVQLSQMARGKHVEGEVEVITPMGRRSTEYRSNPILQGEKVVGVQCILRDNTERKKAEESLKESQKKFEGLFMGNPEAAVYLGPDYHILDINPCFEKLFGYNLAEIRGRLLDDVIVPNDKREEAESLNKKAVRGYVYHSTVRRRKDGSLVPVAISAAPIPTKGKPEGYIGTYKDISELKRVERKLEMMNEKLRVVGNLTRHDVRNKLTVITANVFLARKVIGGEVKTSEYLNEVESACDQIVRIFDFAKDYEMLGVEQLEYVDVEKIINEAISIFRNLQEIEITNGCRGLNVLSDSLLRQLFYNLIDNSLKYGEKTKHIKIYFFKPENDLLKLVYEDDGVGISSDARPNLFKEGFTKGKGSGYGLFLIKKMMEVYGWTIQETGTPSTGTQFIITIPKQGADGRESYRID
jgi:PAS domain S-box-containing protein